MTTHSNLAAGAMVSLLAGALLVGVWNQQGPAPEEALAGPASDSYLAVEAPGESAAVVPELDEIRDLCRRAGYRDAPRSANRQSKLAALERHAPTLREHGVHTGIPR